MGKTNIGLIFGGVSTEHEVSRRSAVHVLKSIDMQKFSCKLFEINKKGQLLAYDISNIETDDLCSRLINIENDIPRQREHFSAELAEKYMLDVIFPVIHGTGGEDGVLQGMFELMEIPYVGAGVAGSAIGFDKVFTKEILKSKGVKQASYKVVTSAEAVQMTDEVIQSTETELGYPVFVKPANGGSSVGIFKAKDKDSLSFALTQASLYDRKILIEQSISGRELECAVIGGYEEAKALGVGEIIPCNEFYDYDAKYIDEGSGILIPAPVDDQTAKRIMETAVNVFKLLDCHGLARIDFFLGDDGGIYLNEINTIPGFTSISMYPKLWRFAGGTDSELISRLIELAAEKKNKYKFLKEYKKND